MLPTTPYDGLVKQALVATGFLVHDVDHAIRGMLCTELWLSAAHHTKLRSCQAALVAPFLVHNVDHAFSGMLSTELCHPATNQTK